VERRSIGFGLGLRRLVQLGQFFQVSMVTHASPRGSGAPSADNSRRATTSLHGSTSEEVEMPENLAKNPLSVLLRAACTGCIIALAILAWLPEKFMTRTTLSGHAEHFIAYLGTAIILGLTFRKSPRLAVQCVLLVLYAAILEAGQLYSPGRHASFQDLAFSSAGVVFGDLFLWKARTRILSWLKIA
jgi:VanZ family protein